MKTENLISSFELENDNPMVDTTIIEGDQVITIILEGVASRDFPRPEDFDEWLKIQDKSTIIKMV